MNQELYNNVRADIDDLTKKQFKDLLKCFPDYFNDDKEVIDTLADNAYNELINYINE